MLEVDFQVKEALRNYLRALEEHFKADCIFFYGPIYPTVEKHFRDFIEQLLKNEGELDEKKNAGVGSPGTELEFAL